MSEPAIALSGHTYERSAIMNWLSRPGPKRDPITKSPLRTRQIVPNYALRSMILEWLAQKRILHEHSSPRESGSSPQVPSTWSRGLTADPAMADRWAKGQALEEKGRPAAGHVVWALVHAPHALARSVSDTGCSALSHVCQSCTVPLAGAPLFAASMVSPLEACPPILAATGARATTQTATAAAAGASTAQTLSDACAASGEPRDADGEMAAEGRVMKGLDAAVVGVLVGLGGGGGAQGTARAEDTVPHWGHALNAWRGGLFASEPELRRLGSEHMTGPGCNTLTSPEDNGRRSMRDSRWLRGRGAARRGATRLDSAEGSSASVRRFREASNARLQQQGRSDAAMSSCTAKGPRSLNLCARGPRRREGG
jgi:hypothetical protein